MGIYTVLPAIVYGLAPFMCFFIRKLDFFSLKAFSIEICLICIMMKIHSSGHPAEARKGTMPMHMIKRWIYSSLRAKMLTMFIILSSIPLVTVGLVSYQKSFLTISDHSRAATLLVADQLSRDIDVLFEDTGKLLELEKNPAVIQFLFSQTNSYADAKEILQTFDLYRKTYTYESVRNISMVNLYGRGISERRGVFSLNQNPLHNDHFQQLLNRPNDVLIIPPHEATALDRVDGFDYPEGNVISMIATVKQRITHEVIGFIVIDLDDQSIHDFANHFTIGKTGYFYVTDPTGQPLFTPEGQEGAALPKPGEWMEAFSSKQGSLVVGGDEKTFIVFSTSEQTGWKIVGRAPLKEIVRDANEIRQLILVSVVISILFLFALYYFLTSRLTRPVQILKNKMRQAASGYLEVKVRSTGTDELADLGNSFNTMIEQIKMLIQQSIREQEQIQKAELRTLQAQINPHFLYNTLDSIIWMAEAGKNAQVIELVQALSRFFRISLSKGRDWITIGEELEHVRNYLVIQQIRYRDILDFDIVPNLDIHRHPILKMILQPLVENALYHGIKNKRGKGLIRIVGRLDAQAIELSVTDNGMGIAAQKLTQLQESLNRQEEPSSELVDSGFGLHNVQQRIRLYYGSQYGLQIESEEGQGTKVSLRIPLQKERLA